MITEELLKDAQAGNSDAFTQIYNETVKTAYFVAKRILIDVDSDVIEDVLQDAYVAVYKHLGDYKAGNFQGWVDTIVANRAKNYMRKKNPILFTEMETEENPVVEFEDEKIEFRPDDNVDYSETKRLVMEIVDGLSAEQRLATILFYFEQRSVKEIAEICECSENTVKSRLNYARKKIKEDVLALEKKGTKLYSISVIPFLIWLLSEEAKACVVSEATSAAVLTGIQSATGEVVKAVTQETAKAVAKEAANEVGKEVAVEAAKATAGAATKTIAAKAGMALGTKIAIAAVATTVTIGGVAGGVAVVQYMEDTYEDDYEEDDRDNDEELNSESTTETQGQENQNAQIEFRLKKEILYYSDENYQNGLVDMTVTYTYAEDGSFVLAEGVNSDGEKSEYAKFYYDEKERLIESMEMGVRYLWVYNEDGELYMTNRLNSPESLTTILHDYDENGFLIKDTEYDTNGEISYVNEYKNDASGKVLEMTTDYYNEFRLDTYCLYEYDAAGNLIKCEEYNANGLTGKEIWEYNAVGNLVKHECYTKNDLTEREVWEYDSNENAVSKVVDYYGAGESYLTQRTFYEYEEVIITGHMHTYTAEETKAPTCERDGQGEITYTCSCGDTYIEKTDRIDHCTDDIDIIQEATCSQTGIKTYSCIFCGREFEREELPKLPHTESDWIVVTEATTTSEGFKHKVCIVCGEELESETISYVGN